MAIHVMVDLETLGTAPDAHILSIGAVKFDPQTPDSVRDAFHVGISHEPVAHLPLRSVSAGTVAWWMQPKQDLARAAQMELERVDFVSAISGFAEWIRDGDGPLVVWCKGAAFDFPILHHAFRSLLIEIPWHYRHERCYRTLAAAFKQQTPWTDEYVRGLPHSAIGDAMTQARHLQEIVANASLVLG